MVTKGFITAIPEADGNKYKVRIPFLESAIKNSDIVIYDATLNTPPGTVGGYAIGDCVYCAFEDNNMGRLVIIGKLYTKTVNLTGELLQVNNLESFKSAVLPENTIVGNVTADNIKALTGVRSNLQWQLNDLDERLSHVGGTVDTAMSDTSTNPVQNMVIKSYVDSHSSITDYDNLTNIPITNLATGAVLYGKTTGLYRVISGNTYKYHSADTATTATEDILFNIYNDTANSKTYAVKIQSVSSMQWVEITSTGDSEQPFIKQTATITSGTKTKITYDAQGLVTAGADLIVSDIPDLSATYATVGSVPTKTSDLTNDSGFITNAGSITTESKTVTYSSMTSGVTVNWMVAYKSGNVVSIYFKFTKSASTSSGSNALTCTLTNMSGWLPPYDAEGFGYYSSCSFGIRLESDGSLTVRNASASSRTLSDGIQFHLTYVI